ncbi:MAG TPA: FHA domain-containing protein, partial [Pyrinomonadaceae bacterium]|nr:FHA domain-containing protein [Pyrinomonadaceae bacterium]
MAGFALTQRMAIKLIIDRRGEPARERVFDGEIVTIGSDPSASLLLRGRDIAAEQAIILNEDGRLLFINRAEGTALNGETLAREARRPLADGDTLSIGPYRITLSLNSASARPEPPAAREELVVPFAPREDEAQQQTARTPEEMRPEQTHSSVTPSEEEPRTAARSFASILDSLRTEEDSFYFQVE